MSYQGDYEASLRLDHAMVLSMARMPLATLQRTVADLDADHLMRVITVGLAGFPEAEIVEWRAHLAEHLGPEVGDPLEGDRRTALACLLAARTLGDASV